MDSRQQIVHALISAANALQLPISEARASYVIGLGLKEAIQYLFDDITEQQQIQFIDNYREAFLSTMALSSLFPGVQTMLERLRSQGYLLAVATGKSRVGLQRVLQNEQLEFMFHTTRCADETLSKPDPLMLNEILAALNQAPEQAVMIGDTHFDIEMANYAKIHGIAVLSGAHEAEQIAPHQPIATFDFVTEIENWLEEQ